MFSVSFVHIYKIYTSTCVGFGITRKSFTGAFFVFRKNTKKIFRDLNPEIGGYYESHSERNAAQLKSHVLVNHWGTILVREPFDGAAEGIEVTPEDYSYEGETLTLAEFMNPEPKASFTLTME